jgi:hypothetical protein
MTNDTLLQEIILAFQAQKLQPIRRRFLVREGGVDFACPLVALAINRARWTGPTLASRSTAARMPPSNG